MGNKKILFTQISPRESARPSRELFQKTSVFDGLPKP